MDGLDALLLGALVAVVVWGTAINVRLLWALSSRALATGTLEGFWTDFSSKSADGNYTRAIALMIAVPVYVLLIFPVAAHAWRHRNDC